MTVALVAAAAFVAGYVLGALGLALLIVSQRAERMFWRGSRRGIVPQGTTQGMDWPAGELWRQEEGRYEKILRCGCGAPGCDGLVKVHDAGSLICVAMLEQTVAQASQ